MSAADRQHQLLEVALNSFSRRGFKGTTTKEIAAAAGVAEAVIFQHFPSKEALYSAVLELHLETSDEQHAAVAVIHSGVDTAGFLDHVLQDAAHPPRHAPQSATETLTRRFHQIIRRGLRRTGFVSIRQPNRVGRHFDVDFGRFAARRANSKLAAGCIRRSSLR